MLHGVYRLVALLPPYTFAVNLASRAKSVFRCGVYLGNDKTISVQISDIHQYLTAFETDNKSVHMRAVSVSVILQSAAGKY